MMRSSLGRLLAVAALLLGAALPVGTKAAEAGATPLILGYVNANSVYWDLDVAIDHDFFRNEGFAPEIVPPQSSPQAIQLLISRSIDLAAAQPEPLIAAVTRGANEIAAFAAPNDRPDWFLNVRPEIKSWADLKGKTLGVSALRVGEFWLTRRLLAAQGLTQADWNVIQVGTSPSKFAALQKGSIAGAVLFQPLAQQAVKDGFPKLAAYDTVGRYPPILYVVSRQWATKNGNGARLGRVIERAHAWLQDPKNRDEAIASLARHTKRDADILGSIYDLYFVTGKIFSRNGAVDKAAMGQLVSLMVENGEIPQAAAPRPGQYLIQVENGGLQR